MSYAVAFLSLALSPVPAAALWPSAATEAHPPRRLAAAAERTGLRRDVLRLAPRAHARAVAERLTTRSVLVERGVVLAHELVAHGRNTGEDVAERFSNGRSQGCPALTRLAAPRVIRLIQDGPVLFAYHPSLHRELAVR